MKKRVALMFGLAALLVATVAWADNTFEGFPVVRVILNGRDVVSDVPGILFHHRTMLPLRALAEAAGLNIDSWDGETNTVRLSSKAEVVGSVNGEPITKAALYDRLVQQGGAAAMDELIKEKLVDQEAAKRNVVVTDAEIDAAIDQIRTQIGGETQLQQAMKQANVTMAQLRANQAFRLKVTKLIMPQIATDEATLKAYFTMNQAQFDKRQVHARHILVATEQQAKEIKAQLDAGADFATLAKAKSIEPAAAQSGGDLGTFGVGQMVPAFERVVFSLKVGEISAPFQTEFGWHVAQVLDKSGSAPDYAAQKDQVREAYVSEQVSNRAPAFLSSLQRNATITNTLK